MSEIVKNNNINEKSIFRDYFLETFFTEKKIKEMEIRGWIDKYTENKHKIYKLETEKKLKISDNNITTENEIKNIRNEIITVKKEKDKEILYAEKIENEGLSENTRNVIKKGIYEYLKNKTVVIEGKRIKFTTNYIDKNYEKFIQNIKKYLIFLMNIESYGGKNIENAISSAKGPLQWIDGFKDGEKHENFDREKGIYSPFETALRRTDKFYNNGEFSNFKSQKTPKYIKESWENDGKLDGKSFGVDKQISLWFTDLIMRPGKAKEYLMGALIGNKWSIKKLYEDIHHTNSVKGSNTKEVVNKYLALL